MSHDIYPTKGLRSVRGERKEFLMTVEEIIYYFNKLGILVQIELVQMLTKYHNAAWKIYTQPSEGVITKVIGFKSIGGFDENAKTTDPQTMPLRAFISPMSSGLGKEKQ